MPARRINEIVLGKRAITADTALRQLTHGELTVQLDSAELRIIDGTAYVAVERIAELGHHLGRWAARDRGDIAERHSVSEDRRDLQQLQRLA